MMFLTNTAAVNCFTFSIITLSAYRLNQTVQDGWPNVLVIKFNLDFDLFKFCF